MILAALLIPCSNISFPGRAPGPGVVHKQGVTGIRQKICPLLRFLTMTCFDSMTHRSDWEPAAVCVGQPQLPQLVWLVLDLSFTSCGSRDSGNQCPTTLLKMKYCLLEQKHVLF